MNFGNSTNPDPEKDMQINDLKNIISNDEDCKKLENYFPINNPHSSAFVDIDGDCINDILIHSKSGSKQYIEFWMGRKDFNGDVKYCLKEIKPIKDNFGLFSISDVNNDGNLDIVFPIKDSSPPAIFVAYNKNFFQYDWTLNYCDSVQNSKRDINKILFDNFDDSINTDVII